MEIIEIIRARHSVRKYINKIIPSETRNILDDYVSKINVEEQVNIQIVYDEPKAFNTFMAHYGKFSGVSNYIVLVGKKDKTELLGYCGEKIVLKAQELGLNTCWVALTYGKRKVNVNINDDEKIHCVIALGYGVNQGKVRKSKKIEDILEIIGEKPEWADIAAEACLLAPTAINQQKFKIIINNKIPKIEKHGIGFCMNLDLGIVKCHFEEVTGIDLIHAE